MIEKVQCPTDFAEGSLSTLLYLINVLCAHYVFGESVCVLEEEEEEEKAIFCIIL